ncbi:hypothetical protein [Georgenia soli]|uniref:hypothetical protein n=1 Tax=Georgenia soli TaxID=638953 RepID=UPI00117AA756|nr:hypothetical protein [Georgenia soli]
MTGPTGVVGGMTAARDVGDLVRHLEADAVGQLTAAAGNESLCTLSRGGEPRPAAKYHEGAAAALAQVRRAVDKQAPAQDPTVTVRAVRDRWTAHAGADTPAWRAYNDGGLDALDALLSSTPPRDGIRGNGEDGGEARPARDRTPEPGAPATRGPGNEPVTALRGGGGRWPRRRTVATAALTPVLLAALVTTGGGWMPTEAPLWTALVALTALISAATLATYLPLRGQGWRPDLGCSPCAAMSAGSVLAAAWLLGSAPLQPAMAVVALAAVAFGLVQRLTGAATTCST